MSIAEELWKGYVQLYDQRRKYGSLPKSVRTSESFSGYITNLKVGHSAILLEVSFRKRDRFRLPDKYVWWPARPKHTAVAFGCLARLNSWPFFFWGGISLKYPHCEYFTLRQFFRWRNPESFCLTFSTFGWSTNSYLDVWGSVVFACGSKWGTPKIGWWSFIYLSSCLRLI